MYSFCKQTNKQTNKRILFQASSLHRFKMITYNDTCSEQENLETEETEKDIEESYSYTI